MKLEHASVSWGSDPEGFLKNAKGRVIGSERVIPKEGVGRNSWGNQHVIQDGVQFELNPSPSSKPVELGLQIQSALKTLLSSTKSIKGVTISLDEVVNVDPEELMSLDESARAFGCAPSKNIRGFFPVDLPEDYPVRSAGGHIHMGLYKPIFEPRACDERSRLVTLMDLLVGNTCVLIDRDPRQVDRRKVYGRASEYREPSHGLEYRVLSNFWLRSYALMELVIGLSQVAVDTLHTTLSTPHDMERLLMEGTNPMEVCSTIDSNDPDRAWEAWERVRPYLMRFTTSPIPSDLMPNFERFLEGVRQKGLDCFFPSKDVVEDGWSKVEAGAFVKFLKEV